MLIKCKNFHRCHFDLAVTWCKHFTNNNNVEFVKIQHSFYRFLMWSFQKMHFIKEFSKDIQDQKNQKSYVLKE